MQYVNIVTHSLHTVKQLRRNKGQCYLFVLYFSVEEIVFIPFCLSWVCFAHDLQGQSFVKIYVWNNIEPSAFRPRVNTWAENP